MQERQRILLRFADLVEKHNDEIAALETWDNGKLYEQSAKIEVPMFVRLFRYYAGMFLQFFLYDSFCHRVLDSIIFPCFIFFCFIKMILYSFFAQAGQIRSMVSRFKLMGPFMFKLCMNQLGWLARLSRGTFLS